MRKEKLHSHPIMERKLGLDDGHVIIDVHTFVRLLEQERNSFFSNVEKQMLEKQFAEVEVLSCDGDAEGKYLPTKILLKMGMETKWFIQEQDKEM